MRNSINPIRVGDIEVPPQGIRPKATGSTGDELTPKVRKPYTITKQRERWTEDEHKRFLEALKLYGRAWRRIEEHIGTKTAVQIRSHAQKFFSKVSRDGAGGGATGVEHIEIPPPRPKRKPVHPYPRKLGNCSHKALAGATPQESSPSPMSSVSGQENGSPTSVLSGICFDVVGASALNRHLCTYPPDSPTSAGGLPSLAGQSPVRDMEGASFATPATDSPMKADVSSDCCLCSDGNSSTDAPLTSLKLFGRTVVVSSSHKSPDSTAGSAPAADVKIHNRSPPEGDLLKIPETRGEPWPPVIYCTALPPELVNAVDTVMPSIPWWALYGGMLQTLIHPYTINSQEQAASPLPEPSMAASSTTAEYKTADSMDHSGEAKEITSSVTIKRVDPDGQPKGFVPYRRCLAEGEAEQRKMEREERQRHTVRLCL